MEHNDKGLPDYLAFMKRRAGYILITSAVLFAACVFVVFSLPSIYRSSAKILIEDPDVSSELITSTIPGFTDPRLQGLQVVTQRVMTTKNLIQAIDRLEFYRAEREQMPVHAFAEEFRDSIELDLVQADVIEPRSGRLMTATIAFTLSFRHPEPRIAQRTAEALVQLFLNENARARTHRASESKDFFAKEAERLRLQTNHWEE